MGTALTWATAPDILTVEEAASLIRVPRTAAYELVKAKILPAVNLGKRRIRIAKAALKETFGCAPNTAS